MNFFIIHIASLIGTASLLLFTAYLYHGPFHIFRLHFSEAEVLFWNSALSLVFFLQHSIMIRKGFRRKLQHMIPSRFHDVLFTIVSGILLMGITLGFQPSSVVLVELEGIWRTSARVVFIAAVLGFLWSYKSLQSFDPFGAASLKERDSCDQGTAPRLIITGAYIWVRHPMYFLVLLLIWSRPTLTAWRLLFNCLWSGWIVVGALLEERDLRALFGDKYKLYSSMVPMVIPWKGPQKRARSIGEQK